MTSGWALREGMESNRASWGPGQERKNTEPLVTRFQIQRDLQGMGVAWGSLNLLRGQWLNGQ